MSDLKIARGLSIPIDAITRTFGIVGQRGTGKTSTAVVLVEEMSKHAPFVVVDPTGAWFGLRSSSDGKGAGVECVVLGGHNGEVPLEESSGAMVADLVLRDRYSLILDLELMRKGRQIRFVADFLEALYHGSREATHVVIDEAQRFAPQNTRGIGGDLPRAVGAMEDLVKLGRRKGLGATVISQRVASLNKEVLEQTETLVVHRLTGPRDRKAIAEWFEAQGSPEDEKEALAALPRLKRGEAYVMSPAFLEVFEKYPIRKKRTFDSSREPGVGETVAQPRGRADVDLVALRDRMAATIERAKSEDPKELRKELASLKRQLAERPTEPVEVEKVVEIPVLANGAVDSLSEAVEAVRRVAETIASAVSPIADELRRIDVGRTGNVAQRSVRRREERRTEPAAPAPKGRADERPAGAAPPADGDVVLKRAERLALSVLIQYPQGRTTKQLAIIAGYAHGGGGFRNALGRLRTLGYITPAKQEPIFATEEGVAALPEIDLLPMGRDLLEHWMGSLKKAEREVLQVLYDAHPEALTAEEIAERTESRYEPSGGGFRNALGKLRTLDLIVGKGEMVASDALFDQAPA